MGGVTQREFEMSLTGFIRELAGSSQGRTIRINTPLFTDGLMDSMKILDLIAFIEASLDIRVRDRQVTLENFRNVQAISGCFWKSRRQYAKS